MTTFNLPALWKTFDFNGRMENLKKKWISFYFGMDSCYCNFLNEFACQIPVCWCEESGFVWFLLIALLLLLFLWRLLVWRLQLSPWCVVHLLLLRFGLIETKTHSTISQAMNNLGVLIKTHFPSLQDFWWIPCNVSGTNGDTGIEYIRSLETFGSGSTVYQVTHFSPTVLLS